ncbi:MAG: DinB family protein [Terracidiphilus sp.]
MPTQIAEKFRAEFDAVHAALLAVPAELADTPWRAGGWTRKQIVGHLLDSAANNRQRIVRASIHNSFIGPDYAQSAWVDAHGYAELPWTTLLHWWKVEHEILAAAVDHLPDERLDAICKIGENAPVTLGFLIEDYFRHQRWHVKQLNAPG